MNILQQIIERAKSNKQTIVLPEGTEERTLKAADIVIGESMANIVLLGNETEITGLAKKHNLQHISNATIIDPAISDKAPYYAEMLYELRKSKGLTPEKARALVSDPLYYSCLMIKNGDADGEVAGARNATGDVLRPAFQIVKTMPGVSVVSGAFLMFLPDKKWGEDGLIIFSDGAVHPNPTAPELAEIAVTTGKTMRSILGMEPRIAMLSFSTKGSARHEMVDKVTEATALAKAMAPDMLIDGELQADAALIPEIAAGKAPGSAIGGRANVLIFPSLDVGNIAYKLVQRLANAEAVGPILQGMAAPINDLSRGCSVDDIVKLVAITANQAMGLKNK